MLERIWIIGASHGIGRELAIEFAKKENTELILSARNRDDLLKLQKEIGKNHKILPLDISDIKQVEGEAKKIKKLDRLIIMAAIYKPGKIENIDHKNLTQTIDINLTGTINLVLNILPLFKKQNKGQIAITGSVAGYIGLPNGQPYSMTKAALINFTETLQTETPSSIDIKLINPGFVKTRMTAKNKFKMPFLQTPNQAAKKIIKDLNKNKFEIHFPKTFTLILKLIQLLPYKLKFQITKKL